MSDEQEKRIPGRALVWVTIEVDLLQPWSPDESVSQVFKRAADEARELVRQKLTSACFRIVGNPRVTAVYMPESAQ